MNSVYKLSENETRFDFTAMRIFLSVIAIFLSVSMPKALAVSDSTLNYQPPVLDKIIVDFKNPNAEPVWHAKVPKTNCGYKNETAAWDILCRVPMLESK